MHTALLHFASLHSRQFSELIPKLKSRINVWTHIITCLSWHLLYDIHIQHFLPPSKWLIIVSIKNRAAVLKDLSLPFTINVDVAMECTRAVMWCLSLHCADLPRALLLQVTDSEPLICALSLVTDSYPEQWRDMWQVAACYIHKYSQTLSLRLLKPMGSWH